jgi:hypothetical protein
MVLMAQPARKALQVPVIQALKARLVQMVLLAHRVLPVLTDQPVPTD